MTRPDHGPKSSLVGRTALLLAVASLAITVAAPPVYADAEDNAAATGSGPDIGGVPPAAQTGGPTRQESARAPESTTEPAPESAPAPGPAATPGPAPAPFTDSGPA
ncbi:MAG: hypothetical protein K9M02_21755, partial [Thiohalocapsa sp.]|nr:hypothetical protein [Thiohalocapsa sp.]